MADIEPIQTRLLHIVRIPSSGLPTRPAKEPLALAQVFAESFGQMGLQAGDMIGKENRRAQYAVSRVHARTALRWRLDEWAPAALVTGVPSCASMGADGTLVSQMAERPPSGTARAYTPSCRGRFGGCSTPRGLIWMPPFVQVDGRLVDPLVKYSLISGLYCRLPCWP